MEGSRPYGRYELLEPLGEGGMSVVDLGRVKYSDPRAPPVVVKRIRPEYTHDDLLVRMFKDEARIGSELAHPNIARVLDFGRVGDEYFMAMEYVPGVDLAAVLRAHRERGEALTLRIALYIATELLAGLDHAHRRVDRFGVPMNVIHRDVSPRNVMLSVDGQVKLIDFGVARAQQRLERTAENEVKGKFAYMAPEQLSHRKVDHRIDVFAAGLVLHEMLTGFPLFHKMKRTQIIHALIAGALPPPPDTPEIRAVPALGQVWKRALAVDPDDRYPSAAAFRDDLLKIAHELGGLGTPGLVAALVVDTDPRITDDVRRRLKTPPVSARPALPRPPRRRRRVGLLVPLAVGVGAGLFAGLIVLGVALPLAVWRSGWLSAAAVEAQVE